MIKDIIEKEESPRKVTLSVFILILSLAAFSWIPFNACLNSEHILISLAAQDFASVGDLSRLLASDGYIHSFPLYSIILSLFDPWIAQSDLIVLLPALVAILATALLAGYMASRSSGHLAGITATSMVITSFAIGLVVAPSLNAILTTFLTLLAWSIWYRTSRIYNLPWPLVWALSLLPVFIAFFASGPMSFIYFYTPLLFMKRPLRTRSRFVQIQHLIPLVIYSIICKTVWGGLFHNEALFFLTPVSGKNLFMFLFHAFLVVFPWMFVAWPIFCASFMTVEKTPIFNRFLRTILLVLAVIELILHQSDQILSPLLAVFAIGGALHYEIFTARYVLYLKRLILFIFKITLPLLIGNMLIITLHFSNLNYLPNLNENLIVYTLVSSVFALTMMVIIYYLRGRFLVFSCRLAFSVVVLFSMIYSMMTMIQGKYDYHEYSVISAVIPPTSEVYSSLGRKYIKEIFYLQRKVIPLGDSQSLPDGIDSAFILSDEKPPVFENFDWKSVAECKTDIGEVSIWSGVRRPDIIEADHE